MTEILRCRRESGNTHCPEKEPAPLRGGGVGPGRECRSECCHDQHKDNTHAQGRVAGAAIPGHTQALAQGRDRGRPHHAAELRSEPGTGDRNASMSQLSYLMYRCSPRGPSSGSRPRPPWDFGSRRCYSLPRRSHPWLLKTVTLSRARQDGAHGPIGGPGFSASMIRSLLRNRIAVGGCAWTSGSFRCSVLTLPRLAGGACQQ